ncbi:hypothetical protein IWX90DRAFT_300077 [Phyllosticta citrichinensis]|uniref:Uncharacterized protein n=1 Tax=Phyllosticta citrichinensis TaxID=1130410 RepID=A0ABR1XKT0_9PEZI
MRFSIICHFKCRMKVVFSSSLLEAFSWAKHFQILPFDAIVDHTSFCYCNYRAKIATTGSTHTIRAHPESLASCLRPNHISRFGEA